MVRLVFDGFENKFIGIVVFHSVETGRLAKASCSKMEMVTKR